MRLEATKRSLNVTCLKYFWCATAKFLCFPSLEKVRAKFTVFPVPWPPYQYLRQQFRVHVLFVKKRQPYSAYVLSFISKFLGMYIGLFCCTRRSQRQCKICIHVCTHFCTLDCRCIFHAYPTPHKNTKYFPRCARIFDPRTEN